MKKVLIISPHFAPVNAPDMQRVRLALPHLPKRGWKPVVLALEPESVEGAVLEPLLEQTYPEKTEVIRVRGLSPRLTRPFGFGAFWWRCGSALRRAAEELLQSRSFDLVFFSSTQFDTFAFGPDWRIAYGVPYVLDFQDPWVNDYYDRTGVRPPGGKWRYALAQRRALREEPRALRGASALISVSPAYLEAFEQRYPWFDSANASVLPFGSSPEDIALARAHPPPVPLIDWDDGKRHLVYAGRGGGDMATALRILFRGFAEFRQRLPDQAAPYHFHFIGTSYAPRGLGRESVRPLALEYGLGAHVHEHCPRVPYFEALHYLGRATAVLAIGSDDPAYNASKLIPCLLTGRPTLAIYHQDGPARALIEKLGGAACVAFRPEAVAGGAEAVADWFARDLATPPVNAAALEEHTASAMTTKLARIFDAAAANV